MRRWVGLCLLMGHCSRQVQSWGIGRMSRNVATRIPIPSVGHVVDGLPFTPINHAGDHVLSVTRAEPTREGSTFVVVIGRDF